MIRSILAALIATFLLAGCVDKPEPTVVYQPQIIKVPVPTKRECQPDICKPFKPSGALPEALKPGDPAATIAYDATGERRLRALIADLLIWGNAMLAHEEAP
jgi:hypothetical protein